MGNIMGITTTSVQPDWAAIADMSAEERAIALAAFGYNDCGFETHDNAVGDLVAWAAHMAQAPSPSRSKPHMLVDRQDK